MLHIIEVFNLHPVVIEDHDRIAGYIATGSPDRSGSSPAFWY